MCRRLAQGVTARPFSHSHLNEAIRKLQALAENAEDARHVPKLLADAGVRFLIIEPLPNTRIDGACFWLDDKSPVIVLSLRYDRIDSFWHTLMHELGHIISGDGPDGHWILDTDIAGEDLPDPSQKPEHEQRADQFGVAALVPQDELEDFITRVRPLYSAMRIQGFANRVKVHGGIVVGQLRHRGEIEYRHHRRFLTPVRQLVTQVALTDGWGSVLPASI